MIDGVDQPAEEKNGGKLRDFASWRMSRVDLDEVIEWLIGRLAKVYPGKTKTEILGWLRGVCESNEYLFIRSSRALALVQIVQEPLLPPRAEERFVFAMDGGKEHAAALYHDIKRWCVNTGLDEYVISRATDIDEGRIESRMGKVNTYALKFVAIPLPAIQ